MAQNPYLQNLLGINQGGMGLYNYNYSLPNYNTLLSQGLTEDQIKGYDTGFNTFNQFPYQAQPNPQLNYPQYGVVPQVPGIEPVVTDTVTDTTSESITPSGIDYRSDVKDTVSTPYGDFSTDDHTQDVFTYPSNKPMNQMSEQELMAYGKAKGYIDQDSSTLMGPMQADTGKLGIWGKALQDPAQRMNDKKYGWFMEALQNKGMMLGGGVDSPGFAQFSQKYQANLDKANFYNTNLGNTGSTQNKKIPGTFKYVQTLVDQYAPAGKITGDNKYSDSIVYHTGSGGHYNYDGNFINHYGQQQAFGSLQDAVDTILSAAKSGNVSTVPEKFLTSKYKDTIKKLIKRGDFTEEYGNQIIGAINEINTDYKPKKEVKKKKDYKPKVTDSGGGGDGTTKHDVNVAKKTAKEKFKKQTKQYKAQKEKITKKVTRAKAPPGRPVYGPHG